MGAEIGEDGAGFFGREIADAGADVEGEDTAVGLAVDAVTLGDVVGDLGTDGELGDVGFELDGFVEGGGADVDGLVDDFVLEAGGGFEEDAGFGGGAGAQLDDSDGGAFSGKARISSAYCSKRARSVRVR